MATSKGTGGESKAGLIPSAVAALALVKASREISNGPEPPAVAGREGAPRFESVPEPDGGFKKLLWRFDRLQRAHPALGFPIAVFKKFGQDKGAFMSALVAYFGFFSVFPLMMAFTSVVGFVVPDPEDQMRLADEAANQMPVVGGTIQSRAGSLEGSVWVVIIGLAVALWSGLRIVDAMQNAMNTVWDMPTYARPKIAERRLRSLTMLFLLGGGIIGSVAVSSLATYVDVIPGAGKAAIWAGSAAVSIGLYWLAYQLLTDLKIPWRTLLPSAIVGGLCWWGIQTFGSPLIARQKSSAGDAYGPFAEIIALLFFLYLAALLSILAAEISVVKSRKLWPRGLVKGDFTDADIEAFVLAAAATRQDRQYEVVLRPPVDQPDEPHRL